MTDRMYVDIRSTLWGVDHEREGRDRVSALRTSLGGYLD
jgi:hypothetical protein